MNKTEINNFDLELFKNQTIDFTTNQNINYVEIQQKIDFIEGVNNLYLLSLIFGLLVLYDELVGLVKAIKNKEKWSIIISSLMSVLYIALIVSAYFSRQYLISLASL